MAPSKLLLSASYTSTMPNSAGGFNSAIVPSKYETASEYPPAIAETYVAQGSSVTEFLTKCVISERLQKS